MWEFLQGYGIWILFGVFFLFMMRAHGHGGHGGGGCGMGEHQHPRQENEEPELAEVPESVKEKPRGGCH